MKIVDNGCGLVKLQWGDVREKVAQVNSKFAQLVDQVSPDCPFYMSYIPYGEVHCDNNTLYYYDVDQKRMIDIRSSESPECVKADLSYGLGSMPLSMVLEKQIEIFSDFPKEKATETKAILKAGDFYPLSRMLEKDRPKPYFPSDVFYGVSGLRQVMMLPRIDDRLRFLNLKRSLKLRGKQPQYLYDHWFLFREIARKQTPEWQSCILYFSKSFMDKLSDPEWIDIKIYLQELAWGYHQYKLNESTFECSFAILEDSLNKEHKPHILDAAKQSFKMSIGVTAGYEPAMDESVLPLNAIQSAFVEQYDLFESIPTVMTAKLYDYRYDKQPIYYPIHYPASFVYSPTTNDITHTLPEMNELKNIINAYQMVFKDPKQMCGDTLMGEAARMLEFTVFHSKAADKQIKHAQNIPSDDARFLKQDNQPCASHAQLDWASSFLRGCVRVSFPTQDNQ